MNQDKRARKFEKDILTESSFTSLDQEKKFCKFCKKSIEILIITNCFKNVCFDCIKNWVSKKMIDDGYYKPEKFPCVCENSCYIDLKKKDFEVLFENHANAKINIALNVKLFKN